MIDESHRVLRTYTLEVVLLAEHDRCRVMQTEGLDELTPEHDVLR